MRMSEKIDQLAAALNKAQAELEGAKKGSNNPFFNSKYADLAAVWDAVREPFTKNGLSIVQGGEPVGDGEVSVSTLVLHTSGQWVEHTLRAKPAKSGPQEVGSCITYLRRYGLQSAAGVCPEDDDGNAAQGNKVAASDGAKTSPASAGAKTPAPAPQGEQKKDGRVGLIHVLFRKALPEIKSDEDKRQYCEGVLALDHPLASLSDLTPAQKSEIINHLQDRANNA